MKKNIFWFTLIEIIIASTILTIAVFWIYKMLSISLLNTSETLKKTNQNILLSSLKECIKNIWYDSLSWSYNVWNDFSINFWNSYTWCLTWSYDNNFSFTWVNIYNMSETWSINYLFANVLEKTSTWIKLWLNIYSTDNWFLYNSWSNDNIWSWYILTITK